MADLITVEQWTVRTGRTLTSDQSVQVTELIGDASALVVDIVDDSDVTDSWDTSTVPRSVIPVVVAMVRRAVDRPHGDGGQRLGDFQYSNAVGEGVFATRTEAKVIRKAAGKSPVAALDLEGYLPDSYRDPARSSDLLL